MSFVPFVISWNITSRCNLACEHCYIDAGMRREGVPEELSTEKIYETLAEIAKINSGAVLIFTGGEPLARPDIYDICAKAASLGFVVVLGTNGTLLTPKTAKKLKESGVSGVGVSIDSLDEKNHDVFRGRAGSLKESIAGLTAAREAGLEIQVQTTPTLGNVHELPAIADWAHKIGAAAFNIFFLVCTGRGQKMTDITPEAYEETLRWATSVQNNYPGMMVRPKCAPHFKRILHQQDPEHPLLSTYIAACRAGTQYCRIDPAGNVTPCPYMDVSAGDISSKSFTEIWNGSPLFAKYRNPVYEGKCGLCKYRLICGGCRARAFATSGNDMGEDNWCVYEPQTQEEAITSIDTFAKFGGGSENTIPWSGEADAFLRKIPVFAQSIVRLATEKYAKERGIKEITADVLKAAAPADRFGRARIPSPERPKQDEEAGGIPWDDDAKKRPQNAPDFVRPGIFKLMQKRAKERGKTRITTEFLSEIRDESMMLVTKRMQKFGYEDIDMKSWDTAKEKFSKVPHKAETINGIVEFLNSRQGKNEGIIQKFKSYFTDDSTTMGWTEGARQRLQKAPAPFRPMAKETVEKYAREHGYKMITEEAIEEAMSKMPFSKFMSKP